MTVILGAGLSGLSCSYHLNHDCIIFEKQNHSGGHIFSHQINGFIWDEGPHVSFTKHEYVKKLFSESVSEDFLEYPVYPTNYYKGSWVPHPAQTNLFAVPEPVRSSCLESFLLSRASKEDELELKNYKEWLYKAFGEKFAEEFPTAYTLKYWTTLPENLTTDWVGQRVFYPNVEDVKLGALTAPETSKHYITSVRYPKQGGYYSYANKLKKDAKIKFNKEVTEIDLESKVLHFSDGSKHEYTRLINTLALPEFIMKSKAPEAVKTAATMLSCSELLLINIVVNHDATINNQWFYVYDQDKFSTRVNFTNLLSPKNGIPGKCGIQVEVYFSKYKKQTDSLSHIIDSVCNEMVEMGLIKNIEDIEEVNTKKIKYANIIFDHFRRASLETIFSYLSNFGLVRENNDLEPSTNWSEKSSESQKLGDLILAGRFGQWNYYWTDDCVMRGLYISNNF